MQNQTERAPDNPRYRDRSALAVDPHGDGHSTSPGKLPWHNPRLSGRIPELDGLRGLAILLVLICHYGADAVPVIRGSWQYYSVAMLKLTWTGVDLFFVLSGFLIGGILYDAKSSRNYFTTFYLRRIHRIFPLYFIWLALFVLGVYLVGPHGPAPLRTLFNSDRPLWSYFLFLQNFFMSKGFGPNWVAMTWSLAVEEQFYLLLPLLVRNLTYRGITILAMAAILGAPVVRISLWCSGNQYYGPYTLLPSRADALAFGLLVAMVCRNKHAWEWLASRRKHLYWALALLACGFPFLQKYQRYLYTVGLTWIAGFYAVLLLLILVTPGWIEIALFRGRALMKLGILAYAVYIFHQGINGLFHFFIFGSVPAIHSWSTLSVTLLSLITVILLASLSWRFIEKPLIRQAHAAYRY
jgi:peptidoglycan/LPS O-acetylase OafA/YrhL